MGYNVHIYRREVEKLVATDPSVVERSDHLPSLTKANVDAIVAQLEVVGFEECAKTGHGRHFVHGDWGAEALLTTVGLFLTGSGENAIFEIGMFASELANPELAKFDPQAGDWE